MRRQLAALLLAAVVPVYVGRAIDPCEDRLTVAWLRGAAVIAIAATVAAAVETVGEPDARP